MGGRCRLGRRYPWRSARAVIVGAVLARAQHWNRKSRRLLEQLSHQVCTRGAVPPAKEQTRPVKIEANSVVVRNGSSLGSVPLVSVPVRIPSPFRLWEGRLAGCLAVSACGDRALLVLTAAEHCR
jgi:hypothetical protein